MSFLSFLAAPYRPLTAAVSVALALHAAPLAAQQAMDPTKTDTDSPDKANAQEGDRIDTDEGVAPGQWLDLDSEVILLDIFRLTPPDTDRAPSVVETAPVPLTPPPVDTLNVMLDWYLSPHHLALLVAQQREYFKRQEIEVLLQPPGDPSLPLKLLADNEIDLALARQPLLHLAVDEGKELIRVATLFETPLNAVITTADDATLASMAQDSQFGFTTGEGSHLVFPLLIEAIKEDATRTRQAQAATDAPASDPTEDATITDEVTDPATQDTNATDTDAADTDISAGVANSDTEPSLDKPLNLHFDPVRGVIEQEVKVVLDGFYPVVTERLGSEGIQTQILEYRTLGIPRHDGLIVVGNRNVSPRQRSDWVRFVTALEEATAWIVKHPLLAKELIATAYPRIDTRDLDAHWDYLIRRMALTPSTSNPSRYVEMESFLFKQGMVDAQTAHDRLTVDLKAPTEDTQ